MRLLDQKLQDHLVELDRAGRGRSLRPVEMDEHGHTVIGGRSVLNFSSNDYLGLSRHPELIERARAWTQIWGTGATASRLVCGNMAVFETIESKIAQGKGSEAALILASGYQCNASVLPALLGLDANPLLFCDRLNHASMHHGCGGVRQIRYRHNDLDHLESLLKANAHKPGLRFILTESVFSMDGDRSDVAALAGLADRYGAFLYIDEAHATGVLGHNGFGLAAGHKVDLVMGTFSKALGGFGAYVACSARLRDYLINRCTGFIFSTGLPASVLGAMDAALDLVPRLDAERQRLAANADKVRRAFQAAGLETGPSSTQIIPVMIGEERRALDVARALEERGILGIAIRPPTVPPGTSRIRFALSARHSDEEIDRLIATVTELVAP